ncbi:hypothetical protein FEM41_02170 [Jejubacter calystegiae]|uniref:Secretory protein n=1 Tax=Jejubacter calystegiae TaxID=2579935 RepID=A0A4P8YDH9_9ENTR|nr:HP1 family phage holin [Jejubacter calystegiae]QCT18530.1 hypothetical protein FEM41_02170 [Jejubacter calystegiae]
MTLERISAFITYCIAVLMAKLGKFDLQDVATITGMLLGIAMFLVSWYYRRKAYRLLESGQITRGQYESAGR